MDADGSYNPKTIFEMYQLLDDYDFVCGQDINMVTKVKMIPYKSYRKQNIYIHHKPLLKLKISDSLFFYPLFKKSDYENINPKSRNFGLVRSLLLSKKQFTLQ